MRQAEVLQLRQQIGDLRANQETDREAAQAALQAEVIARQALEASAGNLQTQVAQLKDGLAELESKLQIAVCHY